ncbi:MAG TPA: oxidoreductase, partial [Rhodocyclaceae bacterium]|nr:oxidoreductase [Rhodocyclaceae bacterium]
LRGHLVARMQANRRDNWLIYGERNARHDAIWAEELQAWREADALQRLDCVYSRDGQSLRYVQDVLLAQGDTLRRWVDEGAAIYVCGSRAGMGEGVDAALAGLLGADALAALMQAGRYRRDVY